MIGAEVATCVLDKAIFVYCVMQTSELVRQIWDYFQLNDKFLRQEI